MPSAWGLVAGLLTASLLGWAVWRVFGGYPQAKEPSLALTARELAFLVAVADATYPEGGPVPPSGTQAGIPAWADRYVASVPRTVGILMRLLFFLMEHATLFFAAPGRGGRRRFSSLSSEQQGAVLEDWRTSSWFPRRLVFSSLRAILTMGFFSDPVVLRALHLAAKQIESPVVEADLLYPAIGAHRSTIAYGPEDLVAPSGIPLAADAPLHPDHAEPTQ
ncbi:MAG: gluconate 2-dehydrogenase subunit 3 family protein [Deltaproteobacteria bacterium]|nr:gluconate 2-dehydrogenase subunit 3 family protein [Deltaproteobacteria bacterium]MBW2393827.1 gluconate 2-dehydrogenase subunit 3 family protein [Deltaproteobacteria bacterium]